MFRIDLDAVPADLKIRVRSAILAAMLDGLSMREATVQTAIRYKRSALDMGWTIPGAQYMGTVVATIGGDMIAREMQD